MSLFNEYGNASIDNQNAVSFSFFLFLKKKKKKKSFNLTTRPAKVSFKGTSLFHFKSQQRTNQLKIKESVLPNQFYQL